MDRIQRFKNLESHPWFNKLYKKLKKDELELCLSLLVDTKELDKNTFAHKTVRLWLDKDKPKNWKHMEELLLACL